MAALIRSLRRVATLSSLRRSLPASRYSTSVMPTDEDQATGLEKKEHDALMAGIEDPFNLKVRKMKHGTKEKPIEIPSMYGERIVGCICEEDAVSMSWMLLKSGPAQRCECGGYFKLIEGNPINFEV